MEKDSFSYFFIAWWHFELDHPPLLCWFWVFLFFVFVYFCLSLHWMDLLRSLVKPTDVEHSSLKSSSLICSMSYCLVSTKNVPTTKPKRLSWCNRVMELSDPNPPLECKDIWKFGFWKVSQCILLYIWIFCISFLFWFVQNALKKQFWGYRVCIMSVYM